MHFKNILPASEFEINLQFVYFTIYINIKISK